MRVKAMVSLLKWLGGSLSRSRCRRVMLYLVRVRLPSEEEAKIIRQEGGDVRAVRVIPREVYNRWKALRFEFYTEMRRLGIKTDLGYLVEERLLPDVKKLLRRVEAGLREIEREIRAWVDSEIIENFVEQRGRPPAWYEPSKRFSYRIMPIELCYDDYLELVTEALTGVERASREVGEPIAAGDKG